MTERFTFKMTFRGVTGKPRGTAIAKAVRATKTQFVVEASNVEVTSGDVRFGILEKRYDRRTLAQVPKRNPFSGNGGWNIDRDSIEAQP